MDPSRSERSRVDADAHRAAREQVLREDGARGLGENLEQADALIRVAFELALAFAASRA